MEQVRIVRQACSNRDWNEKIKRQFEAFMIESYLADGRQNQPEVFGCSITDPCLGWGKYRGLGRRNLCYLNKISEKDGVGGISTLLTKNDSWTRN